MMAEEKGLVGRFLSRLTKPFNRRTTPKPMMPLMEDGHSRTRFSSRCINTRSLRDSSRINNLENNNQHLMSRNIPPWILLGEKVSQEMH